MINKIKYILIIFFIKLIFFNIAQANEQFNFDVTKIEILENGNLFKGLDRGKIIVNNGIIINANNFEYDKILNRLKANGEVEIIDTIENYKIYSDKVTYFKKEEKIFTEGNSRAINKNITINANKLIHNKILNTFKANGDASIVDKFNNFIISSQDITYFKDYEKFFSSGKTNAVIESKYIFDSEDVILLRNKMELSSKKSTKIKDDKANHYSLSSFKYFIETKNLNGENVKIVTNYNLPLSDTYYFKDGFFNFKNQNFIAKNPKIKLHTTLFGNKENSPRLYGASSSSKNGLTIIKKGIFTSCNENSSCPAWSISANKITHDRNKKQITYDDAVLKIYDYPVLYFPKFFHPDPSVNRQSGFLKPQLNSSNVLGSSIYVPYYHVISDNKDYTFKPTIFENNMQMLQSEYREENKDSSFIGDFSYTRGYKSETSKSTNSISHLFAKYTADLNFNNFIESDLIISVQKVTNDTYLKVFDGNLAESKMKPTNKDTLTSEIKLTLDHQNYNLTTGMQSFENLKLQNSDRYQFILPYFELNKNSYQENIKGEINFLSSGSNDLNNTNNLKTKLINDIQYKSDNFVSSLGTVNNFNINLKNLNTLGKKDNTYKSSPQIELMNIFELNSSLPLIKKDAIYSETLTPKVSLRYNLNDMKDYSGTDRNVNVDNVFDINRLGLDDSFEAGKSITMGVNYKKENLRDINKYFEFKIASVLRDKEEKFIPTSSTINKKNSNLFGSATSSLSKNISLDYDFTIDNNFNTFEYNSINTIFNFGKFEANLKFIEENGNTGDTNIFENKTSYTFDDKNYFSFATRRNRKINLTEFYDLVYEYKNDCIVAGIKYNKTYYSDRDLKPTENLFFSVTLYPLTTYEYNLDGNPIN